MAPPPVATLVESLNEDAPAEVKLWLLRTLNRQCPVDWCQIASETAFLEGILGRFEGEARNGLSLLLSQVYFHLDNYAESLRYGLMSQGWLVQYVDDFYGGGDDSNPCRDYVNKVISLALDEYVRLKSATDDALEGYISEKIGNVASERHADENLLADMNDAGLPEQPTIRHTSSFGGGYTNLPSAAHAPGGTSVTLEKLQSFVDHLLTLSPSGSPEAVEEFTKLLIGLAIDSCDEQKVRSLLEDSQDTFGLMRYVMHNHDHLMSRSKNFRSITFNIIRDIYSQRLFDGKTVNKALVEELPTYIQALYLCKDTATIADVLLTLSESEDEADRMRAYQLAFDLLDYGAQSLIKEIRNKLQSKRDERDSAEEMPNDATKSTDLDAPPAPPSGNIPGPAAISLTTPNNVNTDITALSEVEKLLRILNGSFQTRLLLKFSNARNQTDLGILETVKAGLGSRYAILHTMVVVAHAFMQRGTTCDVFLRNNLDWFSKISYWGKFVATASLGVVHQTHGDKSFRVLSTYLPGVPGWSPGNSFSDGGAMYALGLIHANMTSDDVTKYLLSQLSGVRNTPAEASGAATGAPGLANAGQNEERSVNEVCQYGASLALGLTAMGSEDNQICETLEAVLMMDNAASGEAAALALGLVMISTGDKKLIETLLTYAEETRHDKIIRACGLAVAFICLEQQEQCSDIIVRMLHSSDPLIRYGGCYTLALAYVGTGKEAALRTLLHMAVSDPSDDVRQGAVLSISYLLYNSPEQAPRIFKFLADSFCYRVRFAAILALGISCAGTGNPDALAILVPASRDAHDIVRQSAFISLGLVLCECSERWMGDLKSDQQKNAPETQKVVNNSSTDSKSNGLDCVPLPMEVREHMIQVSLDPKEDLMARVGAIVGLGIIDAGGRNCSVLSSTKRESIVGLVLFSQYWYWYPLMLCLSLAITPTALLGIDKTFRVPGKFYEECTTQRSLFAYPPKYERERKSKKVKVTKSVLTAATRLGGAAAAPPAKEEAPAPMPTTPPAEKTPEPPTHLIRNGSRVLKMQQPFVRYVNSCAYSPVFQKRRTTNGGIIVLQRAPGTDDDSEDTHLLEPNDQ